MSASRPLREILDQRIAIHDGSWGVLIHRARALGGRVPRRAAPRPRPRRQGGPGSPQPDAARTSSRRSTTRTSTPGADIATTNTFTATSIGQADYALEGLAAEMSREGARLARAAADAWTARTPERPRFVAGAIGPLNVSLSVSPKVDDACFRSVTFDAGPRELRRADRRARRGRGRPPPRRDDLRHAEREGGDRRGRGRRARAAALALVHGHRPERPEPLRADLGGVLGLGRARAPADRRGQLLARRDRDAAVPRGARPGRRHVRRRAIRTPASRTRWASTTSSRATRAGSSAAFAEDGLVNLVGGCCGTTPEHVRQIAAAVEGIAPRPIPTPVPRPRWSGLEPFEIGPDTGFVMIGERTNVTGSARFRSLVEAGDLEAAVEVALEQVRNGANALDVNMDADLLDGEATMTRFLNLLATEPEAARLPIMVDSSRWSVLEAGLKCLQGKGIVNSISLKEGEEPFLEHARVIRRYGAGVVVMAFDEQGQAETVERKVEICERAYRLLAERGGLRAGGHRLRPERPRRRDRDRGARRVREGVHRGAPADQGAVPGRADERRHLEPLVRVPREPARARGDARRVPLPRDPRGPRHGDRQRGPADGLRGHRARAARARRGRDLEPPARRDGAARRARGPVRGDEAVRAGGGPLLARGTRGEAARARARPRHRRLHRGRRRGGAAGGGRGRST